MARGGKFSESDDYFGILTPVAIVLQKQQIPIAVYRCFSILGN
jgi:hypothetical protein